MSILWSTKKRVCFGCIIFWVVGLVTAGILVGVMTPKAPTVAIKSSHMDYFNYNADLATLSFNVNSGVTVIIEVYNPNYINIPINAISFNIYFSGASTNNQDEQVGTMQHGAIVFAKRETTDFAIAANMTSNNPLVAQEIKNDYDNNKLKLHFSGYLEFKIVATFKVDKDFTQTFGQ